LDLVEPFEGAEVRQMRMASVSTLQVLSCLVIAAAGLVPVFHQNRPFWGLYCISINDGPPRVHQVDPDSPAHAAGLQVDDEIRTANGSAVHNSGLMAVLDRLKPGEAARLCVKRGEADLDVAAVGVDPPVAMIYYPTVGHPIVGGVGLALGLLIFATQPLRPAPRWRAALVGAAGVGLAAVFFWGVIEDNIFVSWPVRRYHPLNWGAKWHFGQTWVGLVASLVLAILGAWELRGLLRRSAAGEGAPQPTNHAQDGPSGAAPPAA
jgi:hypothetical protein